MCLNMPLRRRGLGVPDRSVLSPRVPARASGHRSPPHAKRRAQESRRWPQTAQRARAKRGEVPCIPPPKSQHVLGAMGQTGDSDTSIAMSLLPWTVEGRTQLCPMPCLSFPQNTKPRPLSPLRASRVCPEHHFPGKASAPPTKNPNPKPPGVGRGIRHRPPSTLGEATSLPERIILIQEGFAPKQRWREAGTTGDTQNPHCSGRGGRTAHQKNSPKMEPIKPPVSAP